MQSADLIRRLHRRTRTGLIAFCLLSSAFLSCAQTQVAAPPLLAPSPSPFDSLRLDITRATQRPGVQRGTWGIVVHSVDRDERLFELQPHALLVPASLAKLATVATAADAAGWDYRFETAVKTLGSIRDGVLQGDLLIVGSGDPTIGGRAGDDFSAWVAALQAAGIRRVTGRVIGDDDAIEDARPQLAWAWDDLGYTGGALFGALNYGENRMVVTITPGAGPG